MVLLSFINGVYSPLLRSRVMSRKFTTLIFQSGLKHKQLIKYYELGGDRKTHSQGEVKPLICVIDRSKNPHLPHVWMKAFNQPKPQRKTIKKLKEPKRKKLLTRNQVIHPHRALNHAYHEEIRSRVKKAKTWRENIIKVIHNPTQCECETRPLEHSKLFRPRSAALKATNYKRIRNTNFK